jgi:hypothetical protein
MTRAIRVETYLDGRLVKETDQVEVPEPTLHGHLPGEYLGQPYATAGEAEEAKRQYLAELAERGETVPVVDGYWRWLLDGNEITEEAAQALLAAPGQ